MLTGSTGRLRVGAADLKRILVPMLNAEAQERVVAVAREADTIAARLKERVAQIDSLITAALEEGIGRQ